MRIAFYREFRPQAFEDVVAQKHIVYPLRQSIIRGEIGHAYLFTGTRGTGKTSLARIYAKAVNCLDLQNGSPCNKCEICNEINSGALLDIIEMDAATNSSVDNIRRLTDEVVFTPVKAKYKVYIIDEVHMLSTDAFNALLKTLEEPPEHAIFILATTEPHRIPATIISRCQRYDFRRIPPQLSCERLRLIADAHGIEVTDEALLTIANLADGTLRDAISLLEQASSGITGEIDRDSVLSLVGLVDDDFMVSLTEAILTSRVDVLLANIEDLVNSGRDLTRAVSDLARFVRNVLIVKVSPDQESLINASAKTIGQMKELALLQRPRVLIDLIRDLANMSNRLKFAPDLRTSIEINLLRMMNDIGGEANGAFVPSIKETQAASQPQVVPSPAMTAQTVQEQPQPQAVPSSAMPEQAAQEPQPQAAPSPAMPAQTAQEPQPQVVPSPAMPAQAAQEVPPKAAPDKSDNIPQAVAAPKETVSTPEPLSVTEQHRDDSAPEQESSPSPEQESLSAPAPTNGFLKEWKKILQQLPSRGHMDIFIMAKDAQPKRLDDTVTLVFTKDMRTQYDRCNMRDGRTLMSALVKEFFGGEVELVLRYEAEDTVVTTEKNQTVEPNWVNVVRRSCQETGIPLREQLPKTENS